MHIKKDFEVRNICGENIVVAHGLDNINFTKVITLNESAADVWNALVGKEFSIDDMVTVITDMYEVDEDTALQDCAKLADSWIEAGLAEK